VSDQAERMAWMSEADLAARALDELEQYRQWVLVSFGEDAPPEPHRPAMTEARRRTCVQRQLPRLERTELQPAIDRN